MNSDTGALSTSPLVYALPLQTGPCGLAPPPRCQTKKFDVLVRVTPIDDPFRSIVPVAGFTPLAWVTLVQSVQLSGVASTYKLAAVSSTRVKNFFILLILN